MKKDLNKNKILRILAGYLLLGIFLAIPALFLQLDTELLKDKVTEASITEYSQSVFLIIICILFYIMARKYTNRREFSLACLTVFFAMLVREQNNFLKAVHSGLWQLLVLIIFIIGAWAIRKNWKNGYRELCDFITTRAGGIMAVGLMMLLVFSRMMGKGALWQAILGQGYVRTAKNMIEEGTETGAYLVILFATLVYWAQAKNAQKQKVNV